MLMTLIMNKYTIEGANESSGLADVHSLKAQG